MLFFFFFVLFKNNYLDINCCFGIVLFFLLVNLAILKKLFFNSMFFGLFFFFAFSLNVIHIFINSALFFSGGFMNFPSSGGGTPSGSIQFILLCSVTELDWKT